MDEYKVEFEEKWRLYNAYIGGASRELMDQPAAISGIVSGSQIQDSLPKSEGDVDPNTKEARPALLGRKSLANQMFPSSVSMSGVSRTHVVFDVEYLFRLCYCYIHRFIDANRIFDPDSVTIFASLIQLTPQVKQSQLKAEGSDAYNTAEYVSSYKLLLGALNSVSQNVAKTKIPAKFDRLSEVEKLAVEQLNVAIGRRGDGMAKAVVPPRGSRMDNHVREIEFFLSVTFTVLSAHLIRYFPLLPNLFHCFSYLYAFLFFSLDFSCFKILFHFVGLQHLTPRIRNGTPLIFC